MPRSFLVRNYFRKKNYWINGEQIDDQEKNAKRYNTKYIDDNQTRFGSDISEYSQALTTYISDYEEEKCYWFELGGKKEKLLNLHDNDFKVILNAERTALCSKGEEDASESKLEKKEKVVVPSKCETSTEKLLSDNIEDKLHHMLKENPEIVKKNIKQFLENNRILTNEIANETGLTEECINIYIDGKENFNENQTKDFYKWYLWKILRPPNGSADDKSFTCYKCGKIFAYQSYLERHIKYVCPDNTGRTWKCSYCGKAFQYPCYLRRHVRSHTGESPYKCDQCDRAFVRSTDLQRHIRNHTGEKPYKCTECNRAFARSTDLKRHMRTHTGEKPYKCWQCGKTFSQSGSLQTHLHTHNKEGNGTRKHAKGSK